MIPPPVKSSNTAPTLSDLEVSDPGVMTSLMPPNPAAASGRYLLTAFHARGGMGEVWRCQDANIGREVALKRLIGEHAAAKERFLAEAQITGQLEHPGIVPIHDMGVDDNGRPYYVMKFVRGRTLKIAIEDFHAPGEGKEPREVARVRLLKIFLDLCHAVAYAHSRGVIHRDLKPENVMLGPYGETVLLDWGLAKLSGQSEIRAAVPPSEAVSGQPSLSGNSAQTQDGSILGSPLYMPPEMAEGRLGEIDQRTDVYLLGATLYEILCGRPPRQGTSRQEILEMARTAPPVPPRKLAPATPRALEAICLKAMSHSRAHRYDDAMSLAEDVQRFLAAEPVSAYREPKLARAWRWAKRHRRGLGRSATAAILVAAVGLSAVLYHNAAALRVIEQSRRDLKRVNTLLDQARFYAASVDEPSERSPYYDPDRGEKSAREAMAITQQWGPRLDALPQVDQREQLRHDLSDTCLLLAQLDLSRGAISNTEVKVLLDRAGELTPAGSRGSHRLRASYLRLNGQSIGAIAEEQLAGSAATSATAQDLFLEGESIRLAGASRGIADMNDVPAREYRAKSLDGAIRRYQSSLQSDPRHYWSRMQLGRCYLALNRDAEAVEVLSACIALRPDVAWSYSARGLAFAMLSRFDEAAADFDRALALDPQCIAARLNRSVMFLLQNRKPEAVGELSELLALPQPPPEAHYYRAQMYILTGDAAAGLGLLDKLIHQRPQFVSARLLRAKARLDLGELSQALLDLDVFIGATGASASGKADVTARRGHLLRYLAAELSGNGRKLAIQAAIVDLNAAAKRGGAATVYADLGAVLQMQLHLEDSSRAFTRAIELAPDNPQFRVDRGWTFDALDRLDAAREDFVSAIKIDSNHNEALAGLGYVEARQGHLADSEHHAALALLNGSSDYMIVHNVACIYAQMARMEPARRTEHEDAALTMLRRAVKLWRTQQRRPNELELIQGESAFAASLRQRPEFRQILSDDKL